MGATQIETQLEDIAAYIRTLDAAEALGEVLHVAPLLALATEANIPPGVMDRILAALFASLVSQAVARGVEARRPAHGVGVLHLCTLVERLLKAIEQERQG